MLLTFLCGNRIAWNTIYAITQTKTELVLALYGTMAYYAPIKKQINAMGIVNKMETIHIQLPISGWHSDKPFSMNFLQK